ncbi:MAG: Nif3-like dinuclear metal center hexameric protein [Bacteroidota bacterium]|nr:Nif3-like dinuclear metal center hexameric protein [Bacteroidota bacterium]
MKIKNIITYLEEVAPLYYQESYDNSGLLLGNSELEVTSALIALDCTESIIEEAIQNKCNLIITHHPLIFSKLSKITGSDYIQRIIIKAIKHDIAIYAIHTNLDNIYHGVNHRISEKLGLVNTAILSPKDNLIMQLVVYCPKKYTKKIQKALFDSGAGNIGNYNECSFISQGIGTFQPLQEAQPKIGSIGERYSGNEERISVVFPKHLRFQIIKAMERAHPYEEVAYQIHTIDNLNQHVGSGMIGELLQPVSATKFLQYVKKKMQATNIRYSNIVKKQIKKVAVCGGSGSFLIQEAKCLEADIFITSDIKYHDFFLADNRIILADIGHYESEQFTKELISDLLIKKFPKFAVLLSKIRTNPINYL